MVVSYLHDRKELRNGELSGLFAECCIRHTGLGIGLGLGQAWPGLARPGLAGPGLAKPGLAWPDLTRPGLARPGQRLADGDNLG